MMGHMIYNELGEEEEAERLRHLRVAPDGFSLVAEGGFACNECGLVLKAVGGCKKHTGSEKCRSKTETLKRKVSLLRARLRPASRTLRAGGQGGAGTQARQGVLRGERLQPRRTTTAARCVRA